MKTSMTYVYGPNVYSYWTMMSDDAKTQKERAIRRMMHRFDDRLETQARKNARIVKRIMQEGMVL